MEHCLVVRRAHTLLGTYAVAVVDCFPLDEVAAWEFNHDMRLLDQSLEFAHLD